MESDPLAEKKSIEFHRAAFRVLDSGGGLVGRILEQVARLKIAQPERMEFWRLWEQVAAMPVQDAQAAVLAPTTRGRLLRMRSPLTAALSSEERDAVWKHVAWSLFLDHYFAAADDLDLGPEEQSDLTGLPVEEVAGWREETPAPFAGTVLDRLRLVVSAHSALALLYPTSGQRARWFRGGNRVLGGAPLDLIRDGRGDAVRDHLTAAVRLASEDDEESS
ncbi:MAG: hypothetical protein HQL33_05050 [Alphaproteobacteria bacterium]|nr:hypothetical protein [Alphaproteobacteria bacterium]MBF0129336.1 hypothetical protein [Alphaproteobacteria bacterium]